MAKGNKLNQAGSPYLRQHAANPVHWQEWSKSTLQLAKEEDKPLIISIGYASCHWCHVMAHETFSNPQVAAFMNEHFVCIKIDREERPDIDQIYMEAAQMLNGSGGWPLHAFALPDGRPFHAGTYYPTHTWMEVLTQISTYYSDRRSEVINQAEMITKGINKPVLPAFPVGEEKHPDETLFNAYIRTLKTFTDELHGGLKGAPKFPMPGVWQALLLHYYFTHDVSSLTAVATTLKSMATGGIYDHAGGGFARYAVDEEWKIPHFEKMLYDNGQLASLYAHAFQSTGNEDYKRVIEQTLRFIEREMMQPDGGFYSSINADSEGEEGRFYVWSKKELETLLTPEQQTLLFTYSNITTKGNWENGKNILWFPPLRGHHFSGHEEISDQQQSLLADALKKLFEVRSQRIRPSTDKKIITSWNAIMLHGFIDAFRATGNTHFREIALKNALFIKKRCLRNDDSPWHSFIEDSIPIEGFLEDYAFTASAFIAMYEITFEKYWLETARKIIDIAITSFYDKTTGLFYYTRDDNTLPVERKHEITDHVIPSSNAELGIALLKAGILLGNKTYITLSEKMAIRAKELLHKSSYFFANWSRLYAFHAYSLKEVAIMGEKALIKSSTMQQKYFPDYLYSGGVYENLPVLKNRYKRGKTTFYICRNKTCDLPVETAEEAMQIMLRDFGE
ncbi:MAG: thioredoxin domain-containing protein [Bacteroidales bacterium]|nr:thioredoxin domain-containing protein [Bacteroidales bacterium]MDD2322144.1 thioredoxin domain-containing protein [Bacteroidales bacterium]MDD3010213.1 thioredoxin domain-containing protein [Bacteroidales bacterium]MDD3961414.1 thioredoxin domain-containing protein [Bacteroidales bacterium]MDY0284850.1 thioredoxin domain-containing protein [Bacteroidales bacterium]